ncbi:PAS domain S-box protein [Bowmanella dokdonensis]|uniref:Sensory/regulatory protein RpfC n=1 Tax=Bowmanella dokdonensis TaxID=751969 RepID=A0A939DNE5_9ALTE|nr:PAS domain S-box protein [Bowmanella dokdonensis]MBN7825994.1 PAS domain S-box protein [Bowmanella dokdonensis]
MAQPNRPDSAAGTRGGAFLRRLKRLSPYALLTLVMLLIALLLGGYADHLNNQRALQTSRTNVSDQLGMLRARLEGVLNSNLQIIQGLIAVIRTEPDMDQARFTAIAEHLFGETSQLRNIGAAPDMVIRMIYPLQGNEKALGLDFLQRPEQRENALLARDTGQMTLAGPIELVQGGQGFVSRIPVYLPDEQDKNFWGLISAVIDVERLYQAAGFLNPQLELNIALRRVNDSGQAEVFFGDPALFDNQPVMQSIQLPAVEWQIAAIPRQGWPPVADNAPLFRTIVVALAALFLAPVLMLVSTARKRRDNERRLKGLFHLSPVGIALNDFETGRFLDANEALLRVTGFSKQELKELDYWRLTPRSYQKQEQQQLEKLHETGQYGPYEKEYIRKDGSRFPVLLNGMLIHDSQERPLIWSIIEDISERKQTEKTLQEQRQQLELVLESTAVGIWDWNIPSGEIRFNERWADIVGYRLDELQPISINTWLSLVHPDDLVESDAQMEKHWRGEADYYICESRMKHKDGHWVWILDTGKVVEWTDDGKPKRMVGTHLDISVQKLGRLELEKSQRELQNFFDLSSNLLCIANTRGYFERINKAFIRVLGFSEAEMLTLPFVEFVHPDDVQDTLNEMRQLNAGKTTDSFTNRYRCRDGSYVFLRWNTTPDQRTGKLYASAVDVSEQIRQEQELTRQRELLENMSHQGRIGAWEADLNENNVIWSRTTREIHEVPESFEPDLENSIAFYKEGSSRERMQSALNRAIEKGTPWDMELQLHTFRGREIWVHATGQAELREGKCVRLFGSFQDIDVRKRAELADQSIARHNQVLARLTVHPAILQGEMNSAKHTLVEQLSLALQVERTSLWLFSPDRAVLYCIAMYQRSTGRFSQGQELKRSDYPKYFAALYLDSHITAHDARQDPRTEEFTDAYLKPNNICSMLDTVITSGDSIIGVLCAEHTGEIRQWGKAEETLIGSLATLAGNVYASEQRKKAERQLIAAKEAAEKAARAKSEFLAVMSHEIRTPMNGVLGMLDLMQDSKMPEDQQRRAAIAKRSAESLLNLLNDILDFSKVDAGKLELDEIEFDLFEFLSSVAENKAYQAKHQGLDLVLDLTGVRHRFLRGDPDRLRQILVNLLGNALKFTRQGHICIRCQTQKQQDAVQLLVDIEDTGIGIPLDRQTELFTPFTQVDASTTRHYGGTGLGLAICKKLCEMMRGSIQVQSEPGQGSCFSFNVSLLPEHGRQPCDWPPLLPEQRVLIAESQALHREVLQSQLQDWGAEVASTDTLAQIGSLLLKQAPHKVLVETRLLDDPDKLKELVDWARGEGRDMVGLIDVSQSHADELARGLTATLSKPVSPLDLARLFRTEHHYPPLPPGPLQAGDAAPGSHGTSTDRVLLVEDNMINQEVAKSMLSRLGLSVEVAENGIEALEKLRQQSGQPPFRLVLMDCQMPQMDGYEATRRIRLGQAGDQHRNIPILAMTANAMQGDEEACLAAGMNRYLSKPINLQKLQACVRELLPELPLNLP